MTALLQARDLSVTIGATPVLRSLSFDLHAGSTLGLVGESGCGKSLTALSLMRLLPPGARLTGSLSFNGEDLLTMDEKALCRLRGRSISMAFQEPMTALNPLQTIGAQVAEVFLRHGKVTRAEALDRAAEVLERVSLPPAQFPLSRYPFELSGGQRQRVIIAIAVALGPKILIADEPTTALDVTTEAQILELLQCLCAEDDIALLFISHDLAAIARLCNRIAIMRDGEFVEIGESPQMFDNLQHPYSKALFAASTPAPFRHGEPDRAARPTKRRPQRNTDTLSTPASSPVLDVQNVSRDYTLARKSFFAKADVFRAVDDISFTLEPGESLGVVGESGSGKSTLVRAVLGLEPLETGMVRINGAQFWPAEQRVQRPLRRQIQAVFQDPYGSFNPRHRVSRIVAEPLDLLNADIDASERMKKVSQCLVDVGLAPADGSKYPHEFSGGQRQRIAIARALVVSPSVVVLDEATSALDVSVRVQILALLGKLSKRLGVSYVFVSHDLDVVRAVTDRVLIMKSGKIVEQGNTWNVFAEPQHPYTRSLIGAKPTLQEEIEKLRISAHPGA